MSKILVSANSLEHLYELLNKDINGVILYIDKLSVNSSFYVDVDMLNSIDFKDKELFVSINKLMHNNDLEYLRIVMNKIKNMNLRILFYDMAVFNIAKEYDIVDKLVIYQDHLNASVLSNMFYSRLGIKSSYVTSDIMGDELIDIKNNTDMEILFTGYGYLPMFYSRRYLITNYLKYIEQDNDGEDYYIINDMNDKYKICEEKYGTTIYSGKPVNLINQLDKLKNIDYIVMHSNNISNFEFNSMVDRFIVGDKLDDVYEGFFDKKTIYRVKSGDKNE